MKIAFHPKLLDCLPTYTRAQLGKDIAAGITVGVLALPLAMAFAIASGCSPTAGIWTAIVAGLITSALGGSRVQIGGPTGAFIPIIYGIVAIHGFANLMGATILAGIFLLAMGIARMGQLIRFIPVMLLRMEALALAFRARSARRGSWRIVMPGVLAALDDADHVADALRARGGAG